MEIKEIEKEIANLDDILRNFKENLKWVNTLEHRELNNYKYTLNQNQKDTLLVSMGLEGKTIHHKVLQSRDAWCRVLVHEKALKEEYLQESKLDRKKKLYSFLLRVFTAFGVVIVSIISLNVALYFELKVPSLLAPRVSPPSSISSVINPSVLNSTQLKENALSALDSTESSENEK